MVSSMWVLSGFEFFRKRLLGAATPHLQISNPNVLPNSKSIPIPSPWVPSSILSSSLCLLRGFSCRSSVGDDDDDDNGVTSRSSDRRSAMPMSFSSGDAEPESEGSAAATRYKPAPNNPSEPIPNRPLTGVPPGQPIPHQRGDRMEQHRQNMAAQGGKRATPPPPRSSDDGGSQRSPKKPLNLDSLRSGKGQLYGDSNQLSEYSFLERFRLGADKKENPPEPEPEPEPEPHSGGASLTTGQIFNGKPELQPVPEDADDIFKKMKENGLIPNAVAMLDGLCKDGLIQEAMKLFGLMREKGTFPEVVIYTAVMEGFCKALKFDDAVRIFRKMQSNRISPNAFTYSILIQGLYKNKRLDDAADFCVQMIEDRHYPNMATFVGLVDCFCRERGVEEAQSTINRLIQRGYLVDEKAIREFLDKRGPFLASVWEAIFGKKRSQHT